MLKKAYLEITDICNLSCSFCPGTSRPKKFLSPAEFEMLAAKLRPYTEYLYLHLMGEPLLHPQLEKILDICRVLEFKVIVTTNGTLLDERGGILLGAKAVHRVNISLQSFEANRGGQLREYVSSCAEFARQAASKGILCSLRLWNRNGLESMNPEIRAILKESFPDEWTESRESLCLADKVWLQPGDRFDWPDLALPEHGGKLFCHGLRDQIGVLCDGTVVPCCLDSNGDIPLGNLFREELEEILNSERARAIYNGFSARKAVEPLCRTCGYAKRFDK